MERHELCVMSGNGDDRTAWCPTIDEEVAAAREVFDRKTKVEKYLAFHVDGPTEDTVLTQFDPLARRIILTPPIMGG